MDRPPVREWFSGVRRSFARYLKPYAGRPITYVEIGNWCGDSALWVCENVLTHKASLGIGIDPYMPMGKHDEDRIEQVYEYMQHQLGAYRAAGRWRHIRDKSQNVLRDWNVEWCSRKIDVLYIDGAHEAHSALLDFCYAFPLLKKGSLVIFDDYSIGLRKGVPHVPQAVDAVLSCFSPFVELLGKGRQAYVSIAREPSIGEYMLKEVADAVTG